MAEHPYMPLWCEKLLAGTIHLKPDEMGAYCRLLATMWNEGGRLRDDEEELRTITGMDSKTWRRKRVKILQFFSRGGGWITQKRLSDNLLKVREIRRKRAAASGKGHAVRWGAKRMPNGMPNGMPNACHPNKESKILTFFVGREGTSEEER